MSTTPVLHQQSIEPSQLTSSRLDDIERIAHRLARVSWIPDVYKPVSPAMAKPWLPEKSVEQAEAEIAAAGMYLASIGRDLTPMTLKLVYVVNGAVDCMYDLISAQVHAHGHELWVEEESHESATVAGKRHGNPRVHRVTFTYEDAVRGGLTKRWSKKDGKEVAVETYAKWTRDMLVARAGKRCAKRVAPEALLSMPPPLHYVHTDNGRVQVANIVHELDPDDDGVVDGEIVEEGERCSISADAAAGATSPGLGAPMTTGASGAGATSSPLPAGPDSAPTSPSSGGSAPSSDQVAAQEPEEAGENGGTSVVGGSTAPPPPGPLPRLATGGIDWREVAKRHGTGEGKLLLKARKFAEARGMEPPAEMKDVADEQLVADVVDWLGPA